MDVIFDKENRNEILRINEGFELIDRIDEKYRKELYEKWLKVIDNNESVSIFYTDG